MYAGACIRKSGFYWRVRLRDMSFLHLLMLLLHILFSLLSKHPQALFSLVFLVSSMVFLQYYTPDSFPTAAWLLPVLDLLLGLGLPLLRIFLSLKLVELFSSIALPPLLRAWCFMHSVKFYHVNNNTVFAALPCKKCKMPHGTLNIMSPCDRHTDVLAEALVLN